MTWTRNIAHLLAVQKKLADYVECEDFFNHLSLTVRKLMNADQSNFIRFPVNSNTRSAELRDLPLLIKDASSNPNGYSYRIIRSDKTIESHIVAIVENAREEIGALNCSVDARSKEFGVEDAALLKAIADCVSVHIRYHLALTGKGSAKSKISPIYPEKTFIGVSDPILKLRKLIKVAALSNSPVILTGETGVGKDLVACLLHKLSPRADRPFVAINCSAIPKDLFECELFGHERGAFSNAIKNRKGLIRAADTGTLFLDEIGDLPLDLQAKLLRVLDTKMLRHVGSDEEIGPLDFRLFCATNKSLKELVAVGRFRADLYYRIHGKLINIPPLRERTEDIPILARFFAKGKTISKQAEELLVKQPWPGNVRQLKHVIESACEAPHERIDGSYLEDLLEDSTNSENCKISDFYELKKLWEKGDLSATELQEILHSLNQHADGNLNELARQLGLATRAEMKRFRNWFGYLKKTGIVRKLLC